jgi:hypothetical protein
MTPDSARLSRRRFLALAAAGAAAALAACGRQVIGPSATPRPSIPTVAPALPPPTNAASSPPATATFPPAPSAIPTEPVQSATPAATANVAATSTPIPIATSAQATLGTTPAPPSTAPPAASAALSTPAASETPAAATSPSGTAPPATSTPALSGQTIVDVRQFGARGDGVTDDTAAIQAAIDAVPDTGGTVTFPPGMYIVAPTVEHWIGIKSNLRLAGAGAQSIIKIRDHAGDWPYLFAPPEIDDTLANVVIEDLTFDANIANNPEASLAEQDPRTYQTFIAIRAGRNLTVRRCRFDPYASVVALSLNGSEIRDCAVTDCAFRFVMRDDNPDYDNSAIYLEGSNYTLSGNRFASVPTPYHEGRACMQAHGGPAQIVNNTATGYQTLVSIGASYFAGGPSSDIVCRDNTITDALIGIMLWPIGTNTLANVTVANNTIAVAQLKHGTADTGGISVVFSPYAQGLAASIAVTGNTIRFQDEGAGRPGDFWYNSAGIALHNLGGTDGTVIEGNTIELAPSAGILIGLPEPGERQFRNLRVANNTITNPGQNLGFPAAARAGVLVTSDAADVAITGNTISDTFAATRCPAAIAFDLAPDKVYTGITIRENTLISANGMFPLRLPDGTQP